MLTVSADAFIFIVAFIYREESLLINFCQIVLYGLMALMAIVVISLLFTNTHLCGNILLIIKRCVYHGAIWTFNASGATGDGENYCRDIFIEINAH